MHNADYDWGFDHGSRKGRYKAFKEILELIAKEPKTNIDDVKAYVTPFVKAYEESRGQCPWQE